MPRRPSIPKDPDAVSGIDYPAYLVRLARRGLTRFISHLDWITLFQQMVFRARLPVVLTEGYNKKLKSKYSPPLPTGVASECEYAEFWLTELWTPEQIYAALHDKLPPDFVLLEVIPLAPPVPKNPWKAVTAARYRLDFPGDISPAQRALVVGLLEECRAHEPVAGLSLKEQRRTRKQQQQRGAIVPAARALFDEAGDPRDDEAALPAPGEAQDELHLNREEHYGKVLALGSVEEFLAGTAQTLTLIGAYGPNLTLHAMRLSLLVQEVAQLGEPPVAVKEVLLDAAGEEWRGP